MSKIFVGMSGGVDSSVAALLLKNEGHDVTGVFMRCYNVDGCQDRDAEDARRVAEHIGIPFYVWDFEEEYKARVVNYMVEGYRAGITPNPDVMCNSEIKFGLFFDRALAAGAEYIATGHYVKVKGEKLKVKSVYKLSEARDNNKDQSYFLWTLTQKQLARCLFPIGDYLKSEVREMARQAGLPTADKKDSQGICFLGRVKLDDFLRQYIEPKTGQVLLAANDGSSKVIGEHDGAYFYTIGQRHRGSNFQFSISNFQNKSAPRPHYVTAKDAVANTVTIVEGDDSPELYKKEVVLTDVNFINPDLKIENCKLKIPVLARVRYRQPLAPATIAANHGSSVISHKLIFEQAQKFVAPGQSAVFYSKDGAMLGGGVIV